MRGIISCISHGAGQQSTYFVVRSEGGLHFDTMSGTVTAESGDTIEYEEAGKITSVNRALNIEQVEHEISQKSDELVKDAHYKTGNEEIDSLSDKMRPKLLEAAALLVRKLMNSAPIIIRFHNDADGSGGACSMFLSMRDLCSRLSIGANTVWMMQRGVSYNRYDAGNDIMIANNYSCVEKPLLVIIDFGTSIESNDGIRELGDKFDIIWLDHHPIVEGFKGKELANYVNPWQYGGDSNYTAGLLTSVFCKTFSALRTTEFEHASLVGDYSKYADPDIGSEISTLLDFITSDLSAVYGNGKSNVTPQEIVSTLSDKVRTAELLSYANIKLEESIIKGVDSLKTYSAPGGTVCLLDFELARSADSKYPLPGRFSSKLLTRLNESGMHKVVLIVSAGSYLLMRIDRELCADLDLKNIVDEMSARHPDMIEGGGGHRCAGAIKIRDKQFGRDISNDLVTVIKKMLGA